MRVKRGNRRGNGDNRGGDYISYLVFCTKFDGQNPKTFGIKTKQ